MSQNTTQVKIPSHIGWSAILIQSHVYYTMGFFSFFFIWTKITQMKIFVLFIETPVQVGKTGKECYKAINIYLKTK